MLLILKLNNRKFNKIKKNKSKKKYKVVKKINNNNMKIKKFNV